jgi:hypothetical protein
MTIKEILKQELDTLNEDQIKEVVDFIAFIKFRSQRRRSLDLTQFASLYSEFAEGDRELAEAGMTDYAELLRQEDLQ